ncbi:uncharacterized protein LOC129609903 [Condylostylus longicornis]|uniref:uncharacterized protein LOC129609903 n=1 Tax=Condylostylus longicornis TaxID=2530218 RepID=UPI00244E3C36|nr:uncharacterized protein LOC129609903 [Condylostylus longicornis]
MASIDKDNIVYGGPISTSVTSGCKTFAQYFLKELKKNGNKIILTDGLTGKNISAIELRKKIIRLTYCLEKLGVREGDVVGICSENRFEFVITIFSIFCLNATAAPLNVTYTERELHHAVNLTKPKLFFVSNIAAERIRNVARNNEFIKQIYTFDTTSPYKDIQTFNSLINNPSTRSYPIYLAKPTNIDENVILITCSSGTTGLPKGVQITQRNLLNTIDRQYDANSYLPSDSKYLSILPWFHAFGCCTLLGIISSGIHLVYFAKFQEEEFLSAIQKYKINFVYMVPPLMVFLAKHPLVEKYDLSSIEALFCGAAPLSRETENAVYKRCRIPIIRQGYGLSECTLGVLRQNENFCKPGSVGALKVGHWAKVIDPETGKILGPNQRGELCFKGECIMKGYIGDQEATKSVLKDGWLHTGDIGYFDNDLEFFIVDRIKELIKYKAFQVPPAEIESILLTNPKVKDVGVVGLPDEKSGELPFAFIVKQPNVELNEKEVIDFVAQKTSPAKHLRGGVKFIQEIPKNPSGKILRRKLKEMLPNSKSEIKSKL